jgi:malate dehydrogenase (oxaloacetate-decarboxylating)
MTKDAIVFAMANPTPEIMPEVAKEAGIRIIGTGRSDYPNQVNNVLCFPFIFRGALDVGASTITEEMKLAARASESFAMELPSPEIVAFKVVDSPTFTLLLESLTERS